MLFSGSSRGEGGGAGQGATRRSDPPDEIYRSHHAVSEASDHLGGVFCQIVYLFYEICFNFIQLLFVFLTECVIRELKGYASIRAHAGDLSGFDRTRTEGREGGRSCGRIGGRNVGGTGLVTPPPSMIEQ